jgi:hypothetical protein
MIHHSPLRAFAALFPANILFNGPHTSENDCAPVHDRFYSPIGVCRFPETNPAHKFQFAPFDLAYGYFNCYLRFRFVQEPSA